MAIPMLKIRRPLGRLIFNMGIATPGKTVFLIETAPCMFSGLDVVITLAVRRLVLEYLIIPLAQRSCWGVYWFHSVRPSIHPSSHVRSVAPTVLVGSISYLYILSSNFRWCVACKVSCKFSKFEFLAIFYNL